VIHAAMRRAGGHGAHGAGAGSVTFHGNLLRCAQTSNTLNPEPVTQVDTVRTVLERALETQMQENSFWHEQLVGGARPRSCLKSCSNLDQSQDHALCAPACGAKPQFASHSLHCDRLPPLKSETTRGSSSSTTMRLALRENNYV